MAYRYGFKTEANTLALQVRDELTIGPLDQLDPHRLATHLAVPIWPLSDFLATHPVVRHLYDSESEAFSAVTVFCGPHRTIVHNDAHSLARQHSNLAHELSHALLQHPPTPALDDVGCRNWDQEVEDEANWLAGALLVSEPSTIAIARGDWGDIENAAARLGVSRQMVQFRVNATGAVKRIQRMRRG